MLRSCACVQTMVVVYRSVSLGEVRLHAKGLHASARQTLALRWCLMRALGSGQIALQARPQLREQLAEKLLLCGRKQAQTALHGR